MSPNITQQLQKVIEEHGGKPVHLPSANGDEAIVVMRASDFERMQQLFNDGDLEIEWTKELEDRRHALLDKKYANKLTVGERTELAILQRQAERHADRVAPPDLQGTEAAYQELLSRFDK